MISTLVVLLLVLAAAPLSLAQTPDTPLAETGAGWRYTTIDLDVELRPDDKSMTVRGTARLRLEIESSSGPTFMLKQNDGESKGSEIVFASIGSPLTETTMLNKPFPPRPGVILSSLRAESPFSRGDEIEIEFEIHAKGKRNQFVVHPKYATASWTSAWYPVPAPSPGEGFGAGLMLTKGTVHFDMPIEWSSVCVGDLTSRTEQGDRALEEWEITDPRAIGFAAGPFSSSVVAVGDRKIGMYRLGANETSIPQQAKSLSDAIDAMSEKFGPYPYNRFSIAEAPGPVPGFWAASEQGFILAKPDVFTDDGGNIALFSHEAAHAWWGNLVDLEGPGGIFLSESLAQFGAVIAIEALEGQESATDFLRFSRPEYISNQCARGYFQIIRQGTDKPLSSIETGGGINHQIADSKGHWIHHMLRRRMGDSSYFGVLHDMIDQSANRSFTLQDFRKACMAAAPEARLDRFFKQWLDRVGAPIVELDWTPGDDHTIDIVVRQTQAGAPYDLDLDIVLVADDIRQTHLINTTKREQQFTLSASGIVSDVLLDPDYKILRWTPQYSDQPD